MNQYQRRADLAPNLSFGEGVLHSRKGCAAGRNDARAKVGSIQATPELINDPGAFAKFQQADLRDVRRRLPPRPRLQQVRACRRRRHGPLPPARRLGDLRRPGAPRAGLVAALPARRRPGQLRLARQRRRRGPAIHRVPDGPDRDGDGPRHRAGHRRLRPELRRQDAAARRAAEPLPQPARQRLGRHRRRHGHPDPAAQPARGRGRRAVLPRPPGHLARGPPRGAARRSSRARTSRPAR